MDVVAPPQVEGKARAQDEEVMNVGVDVIATDTGACFVGLHIPKVTLLLSADDRPR
jgi:hypothetical protein